MTTCTPQRPNQSSVGNRTVLAGGAMQPLPLPYCGSFGITDGIVTAAFAELAEASGTYGMAGGQAIDLANVGRAMTQSALEEIRMKTGAMFEAAR